jgi:hypothetical protein
MREIEAIRIIKRKPKLKDMLDFCRGKDKGIVIMKIRALFGKENKDLVEDKRFLTLSQ